MNLLPILYPRRPAWRQRLWLAWREVVKGGPGDLAALLALGGAMASVLLPLALLVLALCS